MVLRWIHYGVMLVASIPITTWSGIVSLIMWDSVYWDNACHGIYSILTNDKDEFLRKN